jgi:N-acetylmuramic acid 6-phosphate etherase
MNKNLPNTELLFDETLFIDKMSTNKGLNLMIQSQLQAVMSMEKAFVDIECVILKIVEYLNKYKNGRLIYVGAGTSGRIGVQDGYELFPTFGWPPERVSFILAGGEESLMKSVESAEDDLNAAISYVKSQNVNQSDIVIGLAASGNTPFTIQVIKESNKRGALTIGISNNKEGKILFHSNLSIFLESGKEVLAGSTRLAAGTTQKICLNLISTLVMSQLGKVKFGQMSSLVANNKKLRERQNRINKIVKS